MPYIGDSFLAGPVGASAGTMYQLYDMIDKFRLKGSPNRNVYGRPTEGMSSNDLYNYYLNMPGLSNRQDLIDARYDFTNELRGPDPTQGLREDGSYGPANQAYGMSADELNAVLQQALENGGDMSQGFSYMNPYTNNMAQMPGFEANPSPIIGQENLGFNPQTPMSSGPLQYFDEGGLMGNQQTGADWLKQFSQFGGDTHAIQGMNMNNPVFANPETAQPKPDQNIPQFDTSMFEQTSFNLPSTLSSGSSTTQASGGYTPMSSGQTDVDTLGSEDFMNILNNKKQAFSQPSASIV